jgi:L-ascorbate metabolism protein UlaG (beta-lactamase superfamily)
VSDQDPGSSVDGRPTPDADGKLLFVGTATTVISYGELNLLTDPNFLHQGQRAYLGYGLSSKRLTEPALSLDDLPELDAVLLSHMHGDHWDRVTRRGLNRDLPIITTPHASKRLQRRGFPRATGLRTWGQQSVIHGGTMVRITAMPGRHAPRPAARLLPPVMGSMLEFGPLDGTVALRLYITGDTLLIEDLDEIPRRYPDIDTGVFHLGGTTLPGGLMVTMNGRQGADLLELIDPRAVVPIHYDDYGVFKSPLSEFRTEINRRKLTDRVTYVERGETISLRGTQHGGQHRTS